MKRKNLVIKWICLACSYLLVATLSAALALYLRPMSNNQKLGELERLLEENFIGELDQTALYDGAAEGMLQATGDRWSYYVSAADYADMERDKKNSGYVGIGITIAALEDTDGFEVVSVTPDGPADEAGILPGDIVIGAEGQRVPQVDMNGVRDLIQGESGTQVTVILLRDGQELELTMVRRAIEVTVAEGTMLSGNIGYITILNFNSKCAKETIAAIDSLVAQGARGLVFDVRGNPGGYKDELVLILDYLLPEGELFRSEDNRGNKDVDYSDAQHLKMPMAVLVNGNSYSAAEFFAAALSEYDWATVVGEQTVGKSYFQYTYRMKDGSAAAISSGKYYTPKGVSLAEVGGLTPDIIVEMDEETEKLYLRGKLSPEEDPQVQAAVESLGLS